MRFLSLFAGIGGFDLGCERAGWQCVGQCEIDPFCRKVLAKHWPNVWRHDDVRTLTGEMVKENCGQVDAIIGGFPCQYISNAGKRAGINGERSGLWSEYFRLICEIRPKIVLVENVAALLVRGIDRVLGDLASIGFDAEWDCLSACELGAPHSRERVFIVAYRREVGRYISGKCFDRKHAVSTGRNHWKATQDYTEWRHVERWLGKTFQNGNWSESNTGIYGVDDGSSEVLDRIAACGNAVVPQVAEVIASAINAAERGY